MNLYSDMVLSQMFKHNVQHFNIFICETSRINVFYFSIDKDNKSFANFYRLLITD